MKFGLDLWPNPKSLTLEGEDANEIQEGVRGVLADYEQLFRVNKKRINE